MAWDIKSWFSAPEVGSEKWEEKMAKEAVKDANKMLGINRTDNLGMFLTQGGNKIGGNVGNAISMGGDFLSGRSKGGLKGGLGAAAGAAGDFMAGIGSSNAKYKEDALTDSQKSIQGLARQGLSMLGPVGQVAAAATGALDMIGQMTGNTLSNIDKDAARKAGISGSQWQNATNYIPGASTIGSYLGKWFAGGRRSDSYALSDMAEEMSSGYAGTVADARTAEKLSNKRFFAGKAADKADAFMDTARNNDRLLQQINVTNTMRKQSDYAQDLAHQNINRYAGQNYLGMRIGREGLKLAPVEEIRAILAKRKAEKLQNGGEIPGLDTSIMPVGSRHSRLNHLDEINPEIGEEVTRKGIPVITVNEDGEVEQVAEIEKNEFTMSKSLTDQIEALFAEWEKSGSEEAMIECGKLVSSELILNTVDPENVIKAEEVVNGE